MEIKANVVLQIDEHELDEYNKQEAQDVANMLGKWITLEIWDTYEVIFEEHFKPELTK